MKKISLNLEKTKKYVVACSFGPDSMALLDACIKEQLNVVVAHVNYHKRDVSNFEEESLKNYCSCRNIECYVLDTSKLVEEGNFQEWARDVRYKFFKSVCEKTKAYAVLVAHQQDDVIETYLMQKKRGNFVKYQGIARENENFGVKIVRPLLNYSKQDLLNYDKENNVPYSIDCSNLTDHYTRNKFRHNIVEKMSNEERVEILKEIENQKPKETVFKTKFTTDEFQKLDNSEIVLLLDTAMQKTGIHRDLSTKFINEIKKAFRDKINCEFSITKNVNLTKSYNHVYIVNQSKINDYKIKFNKVFKSEFLIIDFSNGAEDRNILNVNEDLIVKNLSKSEKAKIGLYYSKINRLFIDWKMPLFLRKMWPGIYDENLNLLYVPRYKENFVDNHKSTFIINVEDLITF